MPLIRTMMKLTSNQRISKVSTTKSLRGECLACIWLPTLPIVGQPSRKICNVSMIVDNHRLVALTLLPMIGYLSVPSFRGRRFHSTHPRGTAIHREQKPPARWDYGDLPPQKRHHPPQPPSNDRILTLPRATFLGAEPVNEFPDRKSVV